MEEYANFKLSELELKRYKVRAETKYRIYDNYFYHAKNEQEAKCLFLKEKNQNESYFNSIKIKQVV